jgi:hypothetical protein
MRKYVNVPSQLITFLILTLLINIAFAGTTGKIRGIVTDSRTGEVLPGVNVLIQGTTIGAATDIDGEYIILLVPPGLHTLEAHMVGYKTEIINDIKVGVDRTVELNIDLEEAILESETVVVEAERDFVKVDVPTSESAFTKTDMESTPFYSRTEDMVALSAGITGNLLQGELEIRQGETYESGMMVDGYNTTDAKFNRPVFSVAPGAVQEIQVIRGGYNAEYGDAQSGVVNIITSDPADEFHVSVDYQLLLPSQRHGGTNKYDRNNMWMYDLYDGPNSMDSTYIVRYEGITPDTAYWEGWNSYAENKLDTTWTADEARELWRWRHRPVDYGTEYGHNLDLTLSGGLGFMPWRSNLMVSFKYENRPFNFPSTRNNYLQGDVSVKWVNNFNPNFRITLTGLYSEIESVTEGSSSSSWSTEDRLSYSGGGFDYSWAFYPFRRPLNSRIASLIGAKFLYIFDSKRFLETDISYFGTRWDVRTGPAATEDQGRYFNGQFYLDPQSGWMPEALGAPDNVSGFRMYGGGTTSDNSHGYRYSFKANYVDQFHPAHELKTGIDFRYNDLLEDRKKFQDDDPAKPFAYYFNVFPIQFSAYIQDKIEFEGMIATIGLRWDYYNVNTTRADIDSVLNYATNSDAVDAYIGGDFPTLRPPAIHYLSPRIGVSFPLTETSKVYFNFGHFVQVPNNEALYSTQLNLTPGVERRIQFMGNPKMGYMKSVNYEIGYDQNLFDFCQLHVGAFHKDYSDGQNGMVWAHINQSLVTEWAANREYKEISGVDIELRRAAGKFFMGFINFNLTKKSISDLSIPGLSDIPIITDSPSLGVNGELKGVPRPLTEEITPYARGVLTFMAPQGWGPRIAEYPFLENTRLSFGLYYNGPELREHPDGAFREQHPDVKFYSIPYFSSNLRISRFFNIMGDAQFELYLDISNLLVSKYRNIGGKDYYDDLYNNGNTDKVGSEDAVTNKLILRTQSDDIYRGNYSMFVLGMRFIL